MFFTVMYMMVLVDGLLATAVLGLMIMFLVDFFFRGED